MSTRCNIAFYDKKPEKLEKFEVLLYRHSDGYPKGVLPEIMPFLKGFKKKRGLNDIEYVSARLLQHLCNEYDGIMKPLELKNGHNEKLIFTGILGYGICNQFHGDIEYLYVIYPNKVEVYDIGKECFDEKYDLKDINKAKLIETETI